MTETPIPEAAPMAEDTMLSANLPPISAHSLKADIAYSYAQADKGPVAIVKGRGKGRYGRQEGKITHVLMSAEHYDALVRRTSS